MSDKNKYLCFCLTTIILLIFLPGLVLLSTSGLESVFDWLYQGNPPFSYDDIQTPIMVGIIVLGCLLLFFSCGMACYYGNKPGFEMD